MTLCRKADLALRKSRFDEARALYEAALLVQGVGGEARKSDGPFGLRRALVPGEDRA
jgi:hypothetical protein